MLPLDRIEALPLFHGLNASACQALSAGATERHFRKGARLWQAGDQPRGLFVVTLGRVRITAEGADRTFSLHTEDAGSTLGEVPLFGGGGYPATAEAEHDTTCIIVSRAAIAAAMAADSALAARLLERLALRVRGLVEKLEDRTRRVRSRIAGRLLARQLRCPPAELTLGITQRRIAEDLGTVREVVVRELRALRDAGILEFSGRGRFVVLDQQALERLASDET